MKKLVVNKMVLGGFIVGMALLFLIIIAIVIFGLIFWILMLIDCAKRNFNKDNDKVVWIVVIALLGVIGAAIYYFVVKLPDKDSKKKNRK